MSKDALHRLDEQNQPSIESVNGQNRHAAEPLFQLFLAIGCPLILLALMNYIP